MRVYSPSQTATFMENPVNRRLQYIEKWRPRQIGKKELSAILGGAVGAGLAEYNRTRRDNPGRLDARELFAEVASKYAKAELARYQAQGFTFYERELPTVGRLPERAAKGVLKYIAQDPVPPSWEILSVEETRKAHGWARTDLTTRSPQGLTVIDYKTKLTLKEDYREKTLSEYRNAWAMLHYAWAESEVHGEHVPVYYIALIILEPQFTILFDPTFIAPEVMQMWRISARRVWAVMEACDTGSSEPIARVIEETGGLEWHTFKFVNQFGADPYASAILVHKLDERLMERDYVRIGK